MYSFLTRFALLYPSLKKQLRLNPLKKNVLVGIQCVPVLQEISVGIKLHQLQSW